MFAVFGMTESYAKDQANKKCPISIKGRALTIDEYQDSVDLFVKVMMQGKKCVRVSNEFSTIELAREFMGLAEKEGGLRLKIRAHVKDYKAKTRANAKNDYVLRWVDMDEYGDMPGAVKR